MMHYDITVNDDCEIRLSVDQTFDEAQANQQTFTRVGTISQEMRTQVPARRKRGPKPGNGGRPRAYSTHHKLNAAIENWPKRATAIVELKRRWVGRHDPTTQDAQTETDTAT